MNANGNPAIRLQEVLPPPSFGEWPRPLDLEVPAGAFCVVGAPPSAGAALLRLCVGLVEPSFGRVEVLGIEPSRLDRRRAYQFRRRLGVALLPGGLVSNLTLRMNLVVPLLYSGAAELEQANQRATEALAEFGIQEWGNSRPADVPLDVRKKAVLARAVIRDPELLLLEDPGEYLRPARVQWFLSRCRRAGCTALITTAERDQVLFDCADLAAYWEEQGLRLETHEVGTH